MAPEIHYNWKVTAKKIPPEEGNVYTTSADVYSLTIVIWELVTELQPFKDAPDLTLYQLADQIMAGLRPCGSVGWGADEQGSVSKSLQGLILSGWNQVPGTRSSAEDIMIRLQREVEMHEVLLKLTTTTGTQGSTVIQGGAHANIGRTLQV